MGSDDLLVISSPNFNMNENYPNQALAIYNIKCPADKPFAYFNTTTLALEEECDGMYVDTYAMVTVV